MKQIIEYIRSYSKALLRKIGVQVRSNLVMKPYGGVKVSSNRTSAVARTSHHAQ